MNPQPHINQSATAVALQQAWQPAASPDFAPAVVRTGWRDDALLVFAELAERDIHTVATGLNQLVEGIQ